MAADGTPPPPHRHPATAPTVRVRVVVTVMMRMPPSVVIFAAITSAVVRVVVRARVRALGVDASRLRPYGVTSTALRSQPHYTL